MEGFGKELEWRLGNREIGIKVKVKGSSLRLSELKRSSACSSVKKEC